MTLDSVHAAKRQLAAAFVVLISALFILCALAQAQQSDSLPTQAAPRPLITQPVNESQLTVLHGNTHPLARPQFDLGTAPAALPMQRMLLVLKRSPAQESALKQLLDDQQNKNSPSYHQWLTPAEFGKQFGPTDDDMQTITNWLQSHGFQVGSSNGRTVLEFSGSAGQVQEAFHTTIHKYLVNGVQRWANSTDPQIPTALASAVAGVASLNNFPRKPMNRLVGKFSRDKATGRVRPLTPLSTFQPPYECSYDNYCFAVGPYDFATIYNVLPLWNANINGTGQTIAIVGESNINPQDVADFRSLFGLPAQSTANGNPLNIILNGPDPGLQPDESEADIDVQWSGAVAPNATIDFVVSQSTETTSGVDLSAVYIVDNNLAGAMSESYGACELGLGTSGNQFYNNLWQQASAQGITVFIAAGDNGSAGCDAFGVQSPAPAAYGLAVSGYASTPYNVSVGGTDFNEFTNPETYWSVTNNSTTQASALGYIPETTWNDSCTNAIWETLPGLSSSPEVNCNNTQLNDDVPGGGSGGASNCTTPSGSAPADCAGGYAKPSWQTGTGVPSDGKRDLPEVSLFASNGFVGSFYVICQSDQTEGSCNLGGQQFLGFGGTSVSSPAFAGIMALINQHTGSRQGNANYVFYKLAAKDTLSSCNSTANPTSGCIFYDVTMGTNAMPCAANSPNCTTSSGDAYGILTGFNASTGYDQATGLGSVNANNLVTQWNSVTSLPSTTTLNSLTPTTITHGQPVNFSVTVKPQSGTGAPTGNVSLLGGTSGTTPASSALNLINGTVSGTTDLLPGGTYSVTAHYPGDATYGPSDSTPISVTVNKENSQPQAFLVTFNSSGQIVSSNTTAAAYGTPYILRVNVENSSGQMCSPASSSGETACPTGTVTMTDNGATLDNGAYTLNSYGYFEDLIVQLPGGTDSVKAAYAGDNSFNASSSTTPITITPASTTLFEVTGPTSIPVGTDYVFSVNGTSQSSGAAPTGTVTFYANGTKLPGTTQFYGSPGSGSGGSGTASFNATLDVTFSTSGAKSVTATYSGDTNYNSSTTPFPLAVSALYQTSPTISSSALNVSAGSSVTLTVLVDSSVKTPAPTGTVTFSGYPNPITGTPTLTTITDPQGNAELQATLTVVIPSSETVSAQYSGDSNYYTEGTNAIYIAVPDFSISPESNTVTVSAGQSQQLIIDVSDLNGFNGTVTNFACSGLPAETTCSFTPPSVTGQGSTTLTIGTTALGQFRQGPSAANHTSSWAAAMGAVLFGICLMGLPGNKRGPSIWTSSLLMLVILAVIVMLPSCGGGGGAGGGGTPNPTPSISSISPTSLAAGSAQQQLTINGTGFITYSNVTLNNNIRQPIFISSTQLSIQLLSTDLGTTATLPLVVSNPAPGGGSSNTVNFSVVTGTPTGNFPVTVTATGATFTHTMTFTLVVQ
jgi:hypothetical protein